MKRLLVVLLLAVYTLNAWAQKADDIVGIWWNDEKTSKIQVELKGGKYIGTIVHVIPDRWVNGKPPVDDKNPDSKFHTRSLVGLQILDGFEYNASKKEWAKGKIYDPKSGKTYDCYGWMEGDVLKLKGFVAGIRWLGRESEWYKTTL